MMSSMLDFGKYLFVQEYEGYKITQEFDGQTDLYEMIANFETFLRAAGFNFEGYLDIVPPDDMPSQKNNEINFPKMEEFD